MSIEITDEMVEAGAQAMGNTSPINKAFVRAALTAALPLIEEKVRAECVRVLELVKNGPIDTSNLLFPELAPKVGEILNSYTDDLIAVITSGRQYP